MEIKFFESFNNYYMAQKKINNFLIHMEKPLGKGAFGTVQHPLVRSIDAHKIKLASNVL